MKVADFYEDEVEQSVKALTSVSRADCGSGGDGWDNAVVSSHV